MGCPLLERWRGLGYGENLSLLEVASRFEFGDMDSGYGFNCWCQSWNGETAAKFLDMKGASLVSFSGMEMKRGWVYELTSVSATESGAK